MHQFRSRVSVLLLAIMAMSLLPVIFLQEPNVAPSDTYIAYGVLVLFIGMVVLLLFGQRYEISEHELVVKTGPFKFSSLKLSEITLVERSYNPLSAPASSLKRLYVKSKSKDTLISPVNEQEFVHLLKARNPNIIVKIVDKNEWWRFWDWDI